MNFDRKAIYSRMITLFLDAIPEDRYTEIPAALATVLTPDPAVQHVLIMAAMQQAEDEASDEYTMASNRAAPVLRHRSGGDSLGV